jgi:hypothetical protein
LKLTINIYLPSPLGRGKQFAKRHRQFELTLSIFLINGGSASVRKTVTDSFGG